MGTLTRVLGMAVSAIATLALLSCSGASSSTPAPAFAAIDDRGESVSLGTLGGKVVLIDFWATWCGPCRRASPAMQRLHEQYAEDGAVVVLGVNVDGKGDPAGYLAKNGYTYPSILENGADVARVFGVSGLPTFVVLDRDGNIVHRQVGFMSGDEVKLGAILREHF